MTKENTQQIPANDTKAEIDKSTSVKRLSRDDLRNIFKTGNTPSQEDFSKLFEAFLNFLDDGIEKPKDESKAISLLPRTAKVWNGTVDTNIWQRKAKEWFSDKLIEDLTPKNVQELMSFKSKNGIWSFMVEEDNFYICYKDAQNKDHVGLKLCPNYEDEEQLTVYLQGKLKAKELYGNKM